MECKTCGAVYTLERTDYPFRDKGSISCDYCGTVLFKWNTSADYASTLISKPTKEYLQKEKGNIVRIFKTKWFIRFAKKEGITDRSLAKEADKIAKGETGDDLGGYVYKLRLSRSGAGKSGGYRVILFFRLDNKIFFDYAYAKSNRDNISSDELKAFRWSAKIALNLTDEQIQARLNDGRLKEI